MKLRTRIAAAGFAAAVLLTPVVANSAHAIAPQAGPLLPAVAPTSQATAAADWLAAGWKSDPSLTKGYLADAIVGLAATGLHGDVLTEMDAKLQTEAAGYATNAGAAGKLALAAHVLGKDPTNYGGVDLITVIQDSLATTPDAGGVFNLPYAIISLVRAGETVPQASIDALLATQDTSGAFGYLATWETPPVFTVDSDSSGLAITALIALEANGQGSAAITDSLSAVIAWAKSAQLANGGWEGYSPSNTTALVGQGLHSAGESITAAQAFLLDQQAKAGGGGLPNVLDGTTPNDMATTQALVLMMGTDYLNLTYVPAQTTPVSTSPATTTPATTTPVTTMPVTTTPVTTVAVTTQPVPTTTGPRDLPNTGADGSLLGLVVLAGTVTTGAGALLARRSR